MLFRVSAAAALLSVAAFGQSVSGVGNFHEINEHLYRGAQPTAQGFRSLAQLGVKTILDLRGGGSRSAAEKKLVEAAGMKYISLPFSGHAAPTEDQIKQVMALFNNDGSSPVFVHCRRGADRTGTVVACYRIVHDHWTNARAVAEAKADGMSWTEFAMHNYVLHYQVPAAAPVVAAAAPAVGASIN